MRLLILYGSQTGTAQDIAENIWRTSKQYNFSGPVLPLDEYKIENLIYEELVLFVVATTGQGDEPDNMKKFWKFLCRKSLPNNSLAHMKFGLLGLGDSSYIKFNFVAKRLFKRLVQLSAEPLLHLGLCDDQHDHGLYATYFSWMKEFWNILQIDIITKQVTKSVFKLKIIEVGNNIQDQNLNLEYLKWPYNKKFSNFKLIQNYRATTKDHFQDVRHIKFRYPSNVIWKPFDIFDVRPWNCDKVVSKFFEILSENKVPIKRQTFVSCETIDQEMEVPICYRQGLFIESAAKYVWDLTAVARQKTFELLSVNCTDELEKEKLLELCSAEGLDEMIKYASRPRRNILEVLNDFPHATSQITLPILFEMFDVIKTRSFSIASCPEEGSLRLLVAVVEYKTILKEPRKGLCSNWLKSLRINDEVLGCIRSGTMNIPNDSTPLVLIGPGTGIAPFRNYLIKVEHEIKLLPHKDRRKIIVFFGCRNRLKDFYFKNDFARLEQRNIAKFYYAFSRDQEHKVYVQHLIKQQQDTLRDIILLKNGIILVAGSSNNMPKQVREVFCEIFGNPNYFEEVLIKSGRYQEEVWS
ncbi:NADPH-dependent diflavin oxidoreductase 1 [Condylostylus longicornis]|uniref:NADPH-dependent diflavin oxidoreductase 1 n=1 Tax=Condylostylus longicornis TaxID=2530218 RepID=UPI00244DA49A|nr:NADPH-dependent diflavin oxidoreductase 1 [Condylostylus longicornis]